MTHVAAVGYVGSIEALCERLCITEDDLEDTLEDLGLTIFHLEDDRCFVTLKEKYQLIDDVCITLDERTVYSKKELQLIKESTGSSDQRIRICQLLDDPESDPSRILELIKDMKLSDDQSLPF